MPMTLAHPTNDPTRDHPVFGEILRGGGTALGGKDELGLPVANFVMSGGVWIPETAMPAVLPVLETFSELLANHLAGLLNDTHGLGKTADANLDQIKSLAELVNTRYGGNQAPNLWASMLVSAGQVGFRKVLNVDAGTYTAVAAGATTISYTGVNLANVTCGVVWNRTDRTLHGIVSVTNPGVNPGVITLDRPINTAAAVLYVPYASLPHAYNSAADATQTLAVVGDPPRINGPATFISVNAAVIAANVQYVLPCALYGRDQIQIVWTCAGTSLLQFNAYGKYDAAAFAAVGTIPAGYLINTEFQHTGTVVFGAPPVGGAGPNIIKARLQDPDGFDAIAIEMIVTSSGGNSTVTGTYRLTGGTA
jgi:hypothetical protein